MADLPKFTGDYLPKEQQDFLHQVTDQPFKESTEALQAKYMQGIEGSSGLLQQAPDPNPEVNYGLNDSLYQAIQKKAGLPFQRAREELKSQSMFDSLKAKFSRMQHAAQLSNEEMVYNERIRQAKYQEKVNRARARAQAMGQILGIAGAAGGAIATGSPAGAAAGYQLGSGLGSYNSRM